MDRKLFEAVHDEFRASVTGFLDRHVRPRHEHFIADRLISRDTWLALGAQGLLGLDVPARYGGGEAGDFRFNAVLTEELAKIGLALASSFGIHYDIVVSYLVDLGTEEQKARWLPSFCTGELVTAIAMTEPTGGTDLAALRTTASRDGGDWILNGSKTFITNGESADLYVVAARSSPPSPDRRSSGITLFAVERGAPGFERGRKLDKVGQPEADTAELFFEDVRVPDECVLGDEGTGFAHMMERLPRERLHSAVTNIAHCAQVLSETLEYARERRAFGSAIGSFQHNKFLLAELTTRVEVTQAYVDACILELVEGRLTPVDAAKAKWWSSQVQNDVLDACVQLFGGYGYMREHRAARAWADARITKIWAGTNEIMKELIGRDLGL